MVALPACCLFHSHSFINHTEFWNENRTCSEIRKVILAPCSQFVARSCQERWLCGDKPCSKTLLCFDRCGCHIDRPAWGGGGAQPSLWGAGGCKRHTSLFSPPSCGWHGAHGHGHDIWNIRLLRRKRGGRSQQWGLIHSLVLYLL